MRDDCGGVGEGAKRPRQRHHNHLSTLHDTLPADTTFFTQKCFCQVPTTSFPTSLDTAHGRQQQRRGRHDNGGRPLGHRHAIGEGTPIQPQCNGSVKSGYLKRNEGLHLIGREAPHSSQLFRMRFIQIPGFHRTVAIVYSCIY